MAPWSRCLLNSELGRTRSTPIFLHPYLLFYIYIHIYITIYIYHTSYNAYNIYIYIISVAGQIPSCSPVLPAELEASKAWSKSFGITSCRFRWFPGNSNDAVVFCRGMVLSFWGVLSLLHWHLFDVEPCFPPACRSESWTESESDWNQVSLPWPLETTGNPPFKTRMMLAMIPWCTKNKSFSESPKSFTPSGKTSPEVEKAAESCETGGVKKRVNSPKSLWFNSLWFLYKTSRFFWNLDGLRWLENTRNIVSDPKNGWVSILEMTIASPNWHPVKKSGHYSHGKQFRSQKLWLYPLVIQHSHGIDGP